MKKINVKGVSNTLSDNEMKNVKGGLPYGFVEPEQSGPTVDGGAGTDTDCNKKQLGDSCTRGGNNGCCAAAPFAGYICKVPC